FDVEPITMPVKAFSRWSGLGVTKIYELIAPGGPLESIIVGKRRLIVVQSYRDLIARQAQNPRSFIPSPNPKAPSYIGPGGHAAGEPQTPRRGRGRPKGSKNRPKPAASAAMSRDRDRPFPRSRTSRHRSP